MRNSNRLLSRRPVKLAVTICLLACAIYFAQASAANGKRISTPTPRPSPHKLLPARAPELPLPAGFQSPCADAREHSLPLPTSVPPSKFIDFEKQVFAFLQSGEYERLGWCRDKGVRDTGPYANGQYYGTHPAVRIFYSPKMMAWLMNGRQGAIPDGAMIIKAQFKPPAARYAGLAEKDLPPADDWTIMIKDAKGAKDGWFWGEFWVGMKFDDDRPPFEYPWAGFGLYCVRCHAVAESESTFASLDNIKGFPGQPLTFSDDGSWRSASPEDVLHGAHLPIAKLQPGRQPAPDFLRLFTAIPGVPFDKVQKMPSETYDHTPMPAGQREFVSSTQCMSCHSGLNGPFGPTMFLPSANAQPGTVDGANVSPYGEWRWSPMGLAGRDPVFFAQLESELTYAAMLPAPAAEQMAVTIRNTCLTCHGAMGKRQLDTDQQGSGDFQLDWLQLTDRTDPNFKYGALARDGISCAVCHRNAPTQTPPGAKALEYFLANSINGKFTAAPANTIFGPYKDDEIAPLAMRNALGVTPRHNPYIQSSRMCGSCHTIDLPVIDGQPGQQSLEQVTYLEWLNSQYQNEFGAPGPQTKSCQDCHMPGGYHSERKNIDIAQIKSKIAIIEDQTYPVADNRAPLDQINVRVREQGYSRHEFLGLNVFLLEIFNQFADVLGVRKGDYMTGSSTDLQDAIDNYTQQAQQRTAQLAVNVSAASGRDIAAQVALTNLAGHRFPSGVGFRRAFIELLVRDAAGNVVWGSGRTNRLGVIVDEKGEPLPSEFFNEYTDAKGQTRQAYQPHYQVIDAQNQAQIYEELSHNADGRFTTSFLRRDETIKDNRLLPIGWTPTGPDPSLNGRYLASTYAESNDDALPPSNRIANDPDYRNGKGADNIAYRIKLPPGVDAASCTVQATLYYQSMPPYYLNDRFQSAPGGAATQRLYFLTSNLDPTGTAIENWKLKIVSHSVATTARPLPPTPGNTSLAILSPAASATLYTTAANLAVRIGRGVNRANFRAFLNGREVTARFAPASNLACTITACDLVATVGTSDGLRTGSNELRVEARGVGATLYRATRLFTMKSW